MNAALPPLYRLECGRYRFGAHYVERERQGTRWRWYGYFGGEGAWRATKREATQDLATAIGYVPPNPAHRLVCRHCGCLVRSWYSALPLKEHWKHLRGRHSGPSCGRQLTAADVIPQGQEIIRPLT